MLYVGCKDIGIEGCDFVAEGEKVRKVESKMIEHLRDAHPCAAPVFGPGAGPSTSCCSPSRESASMVASVSSGWT
jgi:predicted small metal-binding protein